MSFADVHNGGANVRSVRATGNQTATAGGAGDNTAVNTDWVSRASARGIALSAKLVVSYSATLAAGATLAFGASFQDATDGAGAGAAAYPTGGQVAAPAVVATGAAGGSTVGGTFEVDIDLAGAREFIRANVTPDLSAGGADTMSWNAIILFFGDQRGFPTKSTVNLASPDLI